MVGGGWILLSMAPGCGADSPLDLFLRVDVKGGGDGVDNDRESFSFDGPSALEKKYRRRSLLLSLWAALTLMCGLYCTWDVSGYEEVIEYHDQFLELLFDEDARWNGSLFKQVVKREVATGSKGAVQRFEHGEVWVGDGEEAEKTTKVQPRVFQFPAKWWVDCLLDGTEDKQNALEKAELKAEKRIVPMARHDLMQKQLTDAVAGKSVEWLGVNL
ncbi:hypothetical protein BT69DRAFT_1294195 [Atractiella rhizophila]|nr:hypothetical protein BT69DRAFT_1294195 [Atractiella rhizophila]